jgi:hypothetical protein
MKKILITLVREWRLIIIILTSFAGAYIWSYVYTFDVLRSISIMIAVCLIFVIFIPIVGGPAKDEYHGKVYRGGNFVRETTLDENEGYAKHKFERESKNHAKMVSELGLRKTVLVATVYWLIVSIVVIGFIGWCVGIWHYFLGT